MVVFLIFLLMVFSVIFIFLKSRGKYDEFVEPLDKKKYPLKALFPVPLYILDKLNYKYNSKYDKELLGKISEISGARYSVYYLKVHWANKLALILAGLLFTFFIGSILAVQKPEKPQGINVESNGKIQRPKYGEGDKQVNAEAEIRKGNAQTVEEFSVPVKEMPPVTDDEKAVEGVKVLLVEDVIKGKNKDLQNVTDSLILPGDGRDLGDSGVLIKWKLNGSALNPGECKVSRPSYGQPIKTLVIEAELSKGAVKPIKKYFKVSILPVDVPKTDQQMVKAAQSGLMKELDAKKDEQNNSNTEIQLPTTVKKAEGVIITWLSEKQSKDYSYLVVLVIGIALLAFVAYGLDSDLQKKIKQRRLSIQLDFPDFLNKLTLLINAGMTVGKAWEKVATENKKSTPLYEEVTLTLSDVRAGKSEMQSYEDFAKRCKIPEVTKFISVILQNIKKGNSELVSILRLQAGDSWEMRKNASKRLGEEASTKMLLPMMIMFLAILIIVAMPAILAMQGM